MNCCTNRGYLIGLLISVVILAGLAYAFQLEPILRILPYGLILLCPLMHIFMMTGHGNHEKNAEKTPTDKKKPSCH